MADVEGVGAQIWSLLEPYRGELESATIYGMPSLRWRGAKAHDYFAAVRPGNERRQSLSPRRRHLSRRA